MEYFELIRKALEYLEMVGGICAFCDHVERVEVNGVVYCNVYGRVNATLRCKKFEPKGKTEFYFAISGGQKEPTEKKEESTEKKEGSQ
jgi:hypothetical protein